MEKSENMFLKHLTNSVVCILLCLFAIGSSAYAYFNASVCSSVNDIQTANYSLRVDMPENVETQITNPNLIILEMGEYDFILNKEGTASTGYCKIYINGTQFVVTEQITDQYLVRIKVEKEAQIEFVACWGTAASEEKLNENQMIFIDDAQNVLIEDRVTTQTNNQWIEEPVQEVLEPEALEPETLESEVEENEALEEEKSTL